MEEILIAALKHIASYGKDGICPYGCDTPDIAIKALVDYENALYKKSKEIEESAPGPAAILKRAPRAPRVKQGGLICPA